MWLYENVDPFMLLLLGLGVAYLLLVIVVLVALEDIGKKVDRKLDISERARTASKRFGRWLDGKFPKDET